MMGLYKVNIDIDGTRKNIY